ncbi:MAG: hypothetical protein AMXMBFR56_21890 [Polyangiaceae bacterium]
MSAIAQPGSPVFAQETRDPLSRVLELGDRELPLGIAVGLVGAALVHGVVVVQMATALFEVGAFAENVRMLVLERSQASYDIEVPEQPEPPTPPAPTAEPEKEEPVEKAPEVKQEAAPEAKAGEPPPAAAEAGKVLTQEPDPDEPVDLTGEGFISGTSDRFAGGTTAAAGTSKTAVKDPKARPGGTEGGKGQKPGAAPAGTGAGAKDASRAATPTSRSWNCGFPPEADFDQIDYATVMISVTVGTDGRAKSVNVLSDPGHGFGRLAKSCAMRMQYNVGVDKDGQPVVKTTSPFPVRFTR